MIKKRIIPTLTYQNKGLVKSIEFENYRFLGDPIQAINVYNLRDVDELLFTDISTTHTRPNLNLISEVMENAFMPMTIGGGIDSIEDISNLLKTGADKICLSTIAIHNGDFVKQAVDTFGGQAIVIAVDYVFENGKYFLITNPGFKIHAIDIFDFVKKMSAIGVSEFFLTSVKKDGTMSGYDLTLAQELEKMTKAGIIINGGASSYEDMFEAFTKTSAVAVAAASIFQFTENTPAEARKFLKSKGIATRN